MRIALVELSRTMRKAVARCLEAGGRGLLFLGWGKKRSATSGLTPRSGHSSTPTMSALEGKADTSSPRSDVRL